MYLKSSKFLGRIAVTRAPIWSFHWLWSLPHPDSPKNEHGNYPSSPFSLFPNLHHPAFGWAFGATVAETSAHQFSFFPKSSMSSIPWPLVKSPVPAVPVVASWRWWHGTSLRRGLADNCLVSKLVVACKWLNHVHGKKNWGTKKLL